MEDNKDKKIKETLGAFKRVSLSNAERSAMFSRIDAFVSNTPVTKKATPAPSPYFWSIFSVHAKGIVFAVIVFVVLGSTSAAAQYSLPGEILYAIKVNINEEVRSLLSVGDTAKAKFESKRAKERLKEASVLARNGNLSESAKVEIETKLVKHVAEVQNSVEKLNEKGEFREALAVGTELEVTLRSSENELSEISTTKPIDTAEDQKETVHLSSLVKSVDKQIELSESSRERTETTIVDSENKEDVKSAAETKRDAVLKLLAVLDQSEQKDMKAIEDQVQTRVSKQTEVTSRTFIPSSASLSVVQDEKEIKPTQEEIIENIKILIQQGEEYLEQGFYREAFDSFSTAFELEKSLDIKTEVSPEIEADVKGAETNEDISFDRDNKLD